MLFQFQSELVDGNEFEIDLVFVGRDDHVEFSAVKRVDTDFGRGRDNTFGHHRMDDTVEFEIGQIGRSKPRQNESVRKRQIVGNVVENID